MSRRRRSHLRYFIGGSEVLCIRPSPGGETWLLQHVQHTAGNYGLFSSVAQAARRQAGHELCWWETGAMGERRYWVGERWYNLRPDALAEYRVGQQYIRFWLEGDRGTMNVRDLAIKFTSYADFVGSREWARDDARVPWYVCVAPDIAQERRMLRVAQPTLSHLHGVELWTTTEVLLNEQGPLAFIWLQSMARPGQTLLVESPRRKCLFDTMLSERGL